MNTLYRHNYMFYIKEVKFFNSNYEYEDFIEIIKEWYKTDLHRVIRDKILNLWC